MNDNNDGGWRRRGTSKFSMILYALVAVLIIVSLYQAQNRAPRSWETCRESLLQQFFSDSCTPRDGFNDAPDADAPLTSPSGQNI